MGRRLGRRVLALATIGLGALLAASACLVDVDESKLVETPPEASAPEGKAPDPIPTKDALADVLPLGATPGILACPASEAGTCKRSEDEHCCVELVDGGKGRCAQVCTLSELNVTCDDTSDCLSGQLCCGNQTYANPECVFTERCAGIQLCRIHAECPDAGPESCVSIPCRGVTIGICGAPNPFVTDFCGL